MKTKKTKNLFDKIFLSVIIPIFNESERISNLTNIYDYLGQQNYSWEVLLVNDGSSDDTLKKAKKLRRKYKFQLITYQQNMGKGFAIKSGMLASTGRFKLFLDIDLSTPLEEFEHFLNYLKRYHVIIGTRKSNQSLLKTRQPKTRENLGKIFTRLSQLLLNIKVSDFTCGFKCFSKEAADQIFAKQTINRWGFDSEILFIAHNLGYKIKEVPVTWENDSRTKVKFPQDIFRSFHELIKIRYNHFCHKYFML